MKRVDYREAVTYLLIILLAVVTRTYGIWEWSLVGDEIFTIKYADERWTGSVGPALYASVILVNNVSGLPEWSIRIPNLLLSIMSFPTFYFLSKKTFCKKTALAGTSILLISDWHLLHSQYARYYMGVFIFGNIAYFAYIEAIKDDSQFLLAISIASCFLGLLFHPTFLVVPLSCAVASALVWVWPEDPFAGFSKRIGKRFFLLSSVAGIFSLPWLIDLIQEWNEIHSSARMGDYRVAELFSILFRLADKVNVILSVSSLFGLYILLKRNTRLGVILGILSGVPVLVYVFFNKFSPPFRERYIFFFFPLVIAFAAILVSEVVRALPKYGLAKYVVLMIVLSGMIPGFVSHYTGKRSLDPEDVVTVLEEKYNAGDRILAKPIGVNYKIGQAHPDWKLIRRGKGWRERVRRFVRKGNRVWIVASSSSIPGVGQARDSWLIEHATLVWRRHAFGYERAMRGMSIWTLSGEATQNADASLEVGKTQYVASFTPLRLISPINAYSRSSPLVGLAH